MPERVSYLNEETDHNKNKELYLPVRVLKSLRY